MRAADDHDVKWPCVGSAGCAAQSLVKTVADISPEHVLAEVSVLRRGLVDMTVSLCGDRHHGMVMRNCALSYFDG